MASFFRISRSLALFCLLCVAGSDCSLAGAETLEKKSFEVSEGTNIALALSPNGKQIAFDLQGTIFVIPVAGGAAVPVTDHLGDDRQPSWSPDGSRIAFQSYRDGNFHLWSVKPDGSDLRQHTKGGYDHREPMWSPDGKYLLCSSDRAANGNYDIWEIELANGAAKQLTTNPADDYQPAYAPDGKTIAFVSVRPEGPGIYLRSIDGTEKKLIAMGGGATAVPGMSRAPTPNGPSWSPDGTQLAFSAISNLETTLMVATVATGEQRKLTSAGEDIFPFRPAWVNAGTLLYTADGRIKMLSLSEGSALAVKTLVFHAPLDVVTPHYKPKAHDFSGGAPRPVKGIRGPAVSPDGTRIAFSALGDLWLLKIGDPKPQRLTDDLFFDGDPAWAPDGKSLAFISDRNGYFNLFQYTLASREVRALTSTPGEKFLPAWTPDGKKIAFLTPAPGNFLFTTLLLDVDSGKTSTIRPATFQPSRPSFSADGKLVAMSVVEHFAARYREGVSKFGFASSEEGGSARIETPFPTQSLAFRLRNGPAWSPDGHRLAYIKDDRLWTIDVDPTGHFTGSPVARTNEMTDSPSWAADSKTIVYLSIDRLRKLDLASGKTSDVPLELTWKAAPGQETLVVRAGKFFDGISPTTRENVDIIVRGNRIAAIQPANGSLPTGARIIDVSGQTVIPGLFEMHAHFWGNFGERLGRLWLGYGITAVRETGSDPSSSVEQRESWLSNRRPGPLTFITGPLMDGGRVYYGYAASVGNEEDLKWHLERAKRLDFDFIKTYVRLPDLWQREVATFARGLGIRVSSHEIYPAALYGVDAVEHLGATSRRGYSPKYTALGKAYDDVIQIVSRSGMAITPTLSLMGGYSTLAPRDPSIFDTPQFQKIYSEEFRVTSMGTVKMFASLPLSLNYKNGGVTVKRLHDAGALITAGTDSPFVPFGLALHVELWNYVESGLTPFDALQTATINAAKSLHVDDQLGSIEVGKIANLVAVDGNPLVNIRDTQRVHTVVANGHVYSLNDLVTSPASPPDNRK